MTTPESRRVFIEKHGLTVVSALIFFAFNSQLVSQHELLGKSKEIGWSLACLAAPLAVGEAFLLKVLARKGKEILKVVHPNQGESGKNAEEASSTEAAEVPVGYAFVLLHSDQKSIMHNGERASIQSETDTTVYSIDVICVQPNKVELIANIEYEGVTRVARFVLTGIWDETQLQEQGEARISGFENGDFCWGDVSIGLSSSLKQVVIVTSTTITPVLEYQVLP